MNRLAQDQPESVELVLAAGLLQTPGSDSVCVHMISPAVRVEQDLETGDMACVLAEDSGLRLEDDELLAGLEAFGLSGGPRL